MEETFTVDKIKITIKDTFILLKEHFSQPEPTLSA